LAALRSGGAPNSAPSLCSVAGLLVAKWVPPTSTPSDFPPRFTDNTLRLRRLPSDQDDRFCLTGGGPPAVSVRYKARCVRRNVGISPRR